MIQGNQFKGIAKWHYAPPRLFTGDTYRDGINNIPYGDYRFLLNTLDWNQLQDGDIIYTHTFYADQLFEKLNKRVVVVTHNCDTPAEMVPPEGVTWFTTNVNIVHERVFSIPIGIENNFWLKDKKGLMISKLQNPKKFRSLVYCNHNVNTNAKERKKPYNILHGELWATVQHGSNGQGFDNYIDNVYNHPFVVCPEGNGIDTHRMWECLYMGTYPIVIKNINNSFYADLPILFLEDWDQMNQKFLYDAYMDMSRATWNLEKLHFRYWHEIINRYSVLR